MVDRTRALAALGRRCAREGVTHKALADALDVHQSTVSRWFSLESKPDADARGEIFRVYRIPVAWWSTPVPSHDANPAPAAQGAQADRPVSTARKRIRTGPGRGQGTIAEVMP